MKFQVRQMDWFKRRLPTPEPKPVFATVDGFQKKLGHTCNMMTTYDDGQVIEMTGARVIHNDIKDEWSVQGMDGKGHMCVVDVID